MKNPKKPELPAKFRLSDKRQFKLTAKRKDKKDSCPLVSPHS